MAELGKIFYLLSRHLILLGSFGDFLKSFLATIVIVLEQLILSIILEGYERPLDQVKVHQVYTVYVFLINLGGKTL